MSREVRFDNFEQFIRALKKRGIEKLAFAEINEKRAVEAEKGALEVTNVLQVEILGYHDSVIYKFSAKYQDHDGLCALLEKEGFEVTRRNRNIT